MAVGIPAELLNRRPDVRQALAQAAAQCAQIGVAEADFYPRIGVLGFLGYTADDIRRLFTESSYTGIIVPKAQGFPQTGHCLLRMSLLPQGIAQVTVRRGMIGLKAQGFLQTDTQSLFVVHDQDFDIGLTHRILENFTTYPVSNKEAAMAQLFLLNHVQ